MIRELGKSVQEDDMAALLPKLREADVWVSSQRPQDLREVCQLWRSVTDLRGQVGECLLRLESDLASCQR